MAIRSRPAAVNKIHTRGVLYDFLNYSSTDTVKYEQDFNGFATGAIGQTSSTPFQLTEFFTGGAGTAAAIVATQLNGVAALVCSSNGSTLYINQSNFLADNNCTLVCRFNLSAITTVKAEMGFVSTNASATLGATGKGLINALATGATSTVNTASADGCAVIMDTASTFANPSFWRMCGSVAGVTKAFTPTQGQVAALQAPVATTFQTIALQLRRVAIASEDVDAEFWVNNVSMGVMRGGACTFNTAMYPYIMVWSASAARTLNLDYFNVYQQRDMTN